eukprot:CAMPEP_0185847840 /NCGR_PEP_ID=MMETSP1354-20130828/2948_1 /TAXON_ID=708628 /ORGANISM="Erythrolobus madagascarensis, Strain CCMP3276" /LENGTH=1195 /DNA_ID=CAMNT_0028548171 /DNA_START=117 /DNA_END=3704 /DNA_ORIENTATION=-
MSADASAGGGGAAADKSTGVSGKPPSLEATALSTVLRGSLSNLELVRDIPDRAADDSSDDEDLGMPSFMPPQPKQLSIRAERGSLARHRTQHDDTEHRMVQRHLNNNTQEDGLLKSTATDPRTSNNNGETAAAALPSAAAAAAVAATATAIVTASSSSPAPGAAPSSDLPSVAPLTLNDTAGAGGEAGAERTLSPTNEIKFPEYWADLTDEEKKRALEEKQKLDHKSSAELEHKSSNRLAALSERLSPSKSPAAKSPTKRLSGAALDAGGVHSPKKLSLSLRRSSAGASSGGDKNEQRAAEMPPAQKAQNASFPPPVPPPAAHGEQKTPAAAAARATTPGNARDETPTKRTTRGFGEFGRLFQRSRDVNAPAAAAEAAAAATTEASSATAQQSTASTAQEQKQPDSKSQQPPAHREKKGCLPGDSEADGDASTSENNKETLLSSTGRADSKQAPAKAGGFPRMWGNRTPRSDEQQAVPLPPRGNSENPTLTRGRSRGANTEPRGGRRVGFIRGWVSPARTGSVHEDLVERTAPLERAGSAGNTPTGTNMAPPGGARNKLSSSRGMSARSTKRVGWLARFKRRERSRSSDAVSTLVDAADANSATSATRYSKSMDNLKDYTASTDEATGARPTSTAAALAAAVLAGHDPADGADNTARQLVFDGDRAEDRSEQPFNKASGVRFGSDTDVTPESSHTEPNSNLSTAHTPSFSRSNTSDRVAQYLRGLSNVSQGGAAGAAGIPLSGSRGSNRYGDVNEKNSFMCSYNPAHCAMRSEAALLRMGRSFRRARNGSLLVAVENSDPPHAKGEVAISFKTDKSMSVGGETIHQCRVECRLMRGHRVELWTVREFFRGFTKMFAQDNQAAMAYVPPVTLRQKLGSKGVAANVEASAAAAAAGGEGDSTQTPSSARARSDVPSTSSADVSGFGADSRSASAYLSSSTRGTPPVRQVGPNRTPTIRPPTYYTSKNSKRVTEFVVAETRGIETEVSRANSSARAETPNSSGPRPDSLVVVPPESVRAQLDSEAQPAASVQQQREQSALPNVEIAPAHAEPVTGAADPKSIADKAKELPTPTDSTVAVSADASNAGLESVVVSDSSQSALPSEDVLPGSITTRAVEPGQSTAHAPLRANEELNAPSSSDTGVMSAAEAPVVATDTPIAPKAETATATSANPASPGQDDVFFDCTTHDLDAAAVEAPR